jgi:hypothetical protein
MSAAALHDAWSFRCSACGRCCNSAPALSLPELLHHQERFIGCLTVRRVPRLRAGDAVGPGGVAVASEADARAQALLSDSLLHRVGDGDQTGYVFLSARAYDEPSAQRCPALGPDARCAIHHDRKPASCAVVPLDEVVADRLQHVVLAARSEEGAYLGADCLLPGKRTGAERLTHRLAVVGRDPPADLARRRRDLLEDKRHWGNTVFHLLRTELAASGGLLERIPPNGFVVMAITPVIRVLAGASPGCRSRCIEYLDAQGRLLDRNVRSGETDAVRDLRSFARANRILRNALASAPLARGPGSADVEAWMGIAPQSFDRQVAG